MAAGVSGRVWDFSGIEALLDSTPDICDVRSFDPPYNAYEKLGFRMAIVRGPANEC
jgi:hypothetical protein